MLTTLKGIVIRERSVGEQDKFIDILTESHGVLELSVRGAKKITSKNAAATQLFAYSTFCMEERRNRFFLNSAVPIHIFYEIREDLEKLCLSSYFAELTGFCVTEQEPSKDILRLLLNCLSFLADGSRSPQMLKSLFELRLLTEVGMMPDILCCKECGEYAPQTLLFDVDAGNFTCQDCTCAQDSHLRMQVSIGVLQAIRHIVLSDFDRLFHYKLSQTSQSALCELAERYVRSHLERDFPTLRFYKSLENGS